MPRTSTGRVLAVTALAAPALALAALPAQAVPTSGNLPPAASGTIPGAWIVTLEDGASPDAVSVDHGRRFGAQVESVYRSSIHGYSAHMSEQAAARVAADPRVASVQRDRVVSADGKPAPTPTASAQSLPSGVARIDGNLSSTVSGDASGDVKVDVAVIDTGIDLRHPDLNVVGGKNCSTGTSYADGNGHGTHVAGTIGARDDNVGVVGVAPGANLYAVRVLDNSGNGSWSSIICGIDWVTQNKIPVANMSLGGDGSDTGCGTGDALHDAICGSVAKGTTYVVAAGNESDDAANHVPAAYDEVITVSALADGDGRPGGLKDPSCRADTDDTFADFSNHGADVDLIAPGVCILSTWKGGGYNTISGTSMASPHVAGAAALYVAAHPAASPAQVRTALQEAAKDRTGATWSGDRDGTHEPLLDVDAF